MSNNNVLSIVLNEIFNRMILPCFLSAAMFFFGPAQFVSLLPGRARFVTIDSNGQVTAAVNTLPATPSFGSAVPAASINCTTASFDVALLKTSHFDYNQEVPFVLIDMVKVLLLVAIALGLLTFIVPGWVFTTIFEHIQSFTAKQIEMPLIYLEEELFIAPDCVFTTISGDIQTFNIKTIEMPLINIKEESIIVEEEKIETTKEEKTSNVVITRKRDSGCFITATDNVKTVSTDAPLQTIQVDENELNSCISQQNQSIESLLESVQVDENELNSCISQQDESTETLESMQAEMDELDRQIWESMQAEMAELDRIILESEQAEQTYQAELDALDIRDAQRESLYSKQKLSIETLLEQAEQEIPQDVEITTPTNQSLEEVVNTCISEQFGLSIKTLLDDAEYEAYISEAVNAFARQLDISTSTQHTPTRTILEDAALEAFHVTLQSKQTKLWTMSSKHCSPVEALTPSTFFSQLFQ